MIKYICDMCKKEIPPDQLYLKKRLDGVMVEAIMSVKYGYSEINAIHICPECRIKILQEGEWMDE